MKILSPILLAFAIAAANGCRKPSNVESHAPEEQEEKTAQITVWSQGYEIFAEHTPPVAGQPTRFITHISDLRTGEPRAKGLVKFVLRKGETSFEHPQAAPDRPGIYLPAITFAAEGEWQASVVIPGDTNAMVNLGNVRVFASAEEAAQVEYPESPEGISFLKEQQWRIRAKTEPVFSRRLVQRLPLHATVVPAPGSKATIHAPVTGTLLPDGMAQMGEAVQAGDLLAWMEPVFNEFTAQLVDAEAEALRARVALEQAEAAFVRVRALHEQQAKSERELQEAELAYRSAQASFEAANTIQQLYRATGATFNDGSLRIAIRAPFDGFVDQAPVRLGERLEPEEALFTVISSTSALVEAHLPESRVDAIQPGEGALLQVTSEGEPAILTNVLSLMARSHLVDPFTRTLKLTYKFPNQSQTLPFGAAVMLLVPTGKSADALAIPDSAIVEEDGIPVVFVQVSGETFQKRDVTPGIRDGEWTGILSGVNEGERVVTDGAYALLLSTKSGTIPAHGHTH